VTNNSAAELILADFRRWLETQSAPPAVPRLDQDSPPVEAPAIDLATVLSHFIALRQEVTLQTRSVRAQQEQNAEVLRQLQQALDLLQQSHFRNEQLTQQGQEERVRPLLKTLVDLYDALFLAGREIQRTQAGLVSLMEPLGALDESEGQPLPELPVAPPSRPFWSRWFLSPTADAALRSSQDQTQQAIARLHRERREKQERLQQARTTCQRVAEALESLIAGYTMSLQRIERALRQHGLQVIPTVGEPFDPEHMEAVEPVRGSGRPAGEVVEEIRRGYLWNNRVFRFAQVRVARD
jgi:molecular chaperone GrpE